MKFPNPFRSGEAKFAPFAPDSKATNPKDAIGSDKIPVHLWPMTAVIEGAMGLLDGMLKYGRSNYRASGVRASIYYDAILRHTMAWFEGEDLDPDSGLPHTCHILACAAIIVDARAAGMLNDDRQYPGGYRALVDRMTPDVARLKAKYADRAPHHYMIGDVSHGYTNLTGDPEALAGLAAALVTEGLAVRPVVLRGEPLDAEQGDPGNTRGADSSSVLAAPKRVETFAQDTEAVVGGAYPALGGLDVDEAAPGPPPTDPGGSAGDAPGELADGPVWPSLGPGDAGDGADDEGPGAGVPVGEPEADGGNPTGGLGGLECYCSMAPAPHPYHLAREEMNDAGDNLELHYFVIREDGLAEDV